MAAPQLRPPWQPGQSGNPSGKAKRLFPRVDELLKAAGKEPITELLKLLPTLRDREQVQLWLEVLPYVHAKVKPQEESEENPLDKMSDQELWALLKEQAKAKGIG